MATTVYVSEGHFKVVERRGQFHHILMPGKHRLLPFIETASDDIDLKQITTQDVFVHDKNPALTADCIKIGFSFSAEILIVDPERHYKNDRWNTFAAIDRELLRILRTYLSKYTQRQLIEQFATLDKPGKDMVDEIVDQINANELIGIEIQHVYFFPHLESTDYKYWKAFCDYSNNKQDFVASFGILSPSTEKELIIPTQAGSFDISLHRDTDNNKLTVKVKAQNRNEIFMTLYNNSAMIEQSIGWDLEWSQTRGLYSTITMTKNGLGTADETAQFQWIADILLKLKESLCEVLNKYGKLSHNERIEVVTHVCSVCGAPIDMSVNVCKHCGTKYTILRR